MQDVLWITLVFHVNVEGDDYVNTLANQGRLVGPLHPPKKQPLWGDGRTQ